MQTRSIGIANCCLSCMLCLLRAAGKTHGAGGRLPAVWRQRHHIGMGIDPFGYVHWARRLGIVYQAYGMLGGGPGEESIDAAPLVMQVAAAHNVSARAVGLKWAVQQVMPLILPPFTLKSRVKSANTATQQAAAIGPAPSSAQETNRDPEIEPTWQDLQLFNLSDWKLSSAEFTKLSELTAPAGRPSHGAECPDGALGKVKGVARARGRVDV